MFLGIEVARETKKNKWQSLQQCSVLTDKKCMLSYECGYEITIVMMLIKNTRESVKFSQTKSILKSL